MEELDLKQLLHMFWNKKIEIILIVFIFLLIGGIYSYLFITPQYQSSTTLILANQENQSATSTALTTTEVTLNQKLVTTYSELVKSKSVLREVIHNLGITDLSEEALKKSIEVNAVKSTELIEIKVRSNNSSYAERIANEIANVFTKKVAEIYNINNVHVVDQAEEIKEPFNINHKKDLIIFAFLGIIVACLYVVISNLLDNTVKTAEEIEKITGLSVIAQIPECDFDMRIGGRK